MRRRVPVQLQMSQVECGAACLAMILSYHGRATRVAECRDVCGAGRDGLTAHSIAEAARGYGLHVKGYSIEPAMCRALTVPAILHWGFNHFVVLERWTPRHVDIVDPGVGRRRLTPAEFDAGFTGVVLVLEPGAEFVRSRARGGAHWSSALLRLTRVPGVHVFLLQILLASLVLQGLGLGLPLLTALLLDVVLPGRALDTLGLLGIGMAVIVVTQWLTTYLRGLLLAHLQQRVDVHLMRGFFEHLLSLPFRFFAQRSTGDLLMRLGSNATIRELVTGETISAGLDGCLVVGYVVVLLTHDVVLAGLAAGLGCLQGILLLSTARRAHGLTQRLLMAQADAQANLFETLRGIATVKASGGEPRAIERWSKLLTAELNVTVKRNQLSALITASISALRLLMPLLLLWVGAQRVLDGSLSVGSMLALNALAVAFLGPMASLIGSAQQLQLARAHLERIGDVLEATPEQVQSEVPDAPRLSGRIELRHVSFRYDANGPWVLRDVSLTIEAGQKVALVGTTGSGKSTLGMLLLGLYQPTEGEILYDGQPLSRFNFRSLRRQIGVVLQEPVLFSDTIRRNVAFNAPDLSLDHLIDAVYLACIEDDINAMPMGWETQVAEGGGGLSGGQIQRLALARALAPSPSILLLDEATSHLDVLTESRVDHNLSRLACTRIVIAHRLSTIRNADVILVLEHGQIVDRGSHAVLLGRDGPYALLVGGQLQPAAV
jgi:ABC-type bacteriocin/lantibiotic exporter with double-glycine peptidase domain